jgi:hypothetical protein
VNLPNMLYGQGPPDDMPLFPFKPGDKVSGSFMTTGSYVTVKSVGDFSFVGIVHGATDWQVDGTELVLGFNLDWEPYKP